VQFVSRSVTAPMSVAAKVALVLALFALATIGAQARSEELQRLLAPGSSDSDGVLPKLKKAVVVDPLSGGDALEALQNIAKILGKEPASATEMGDDLEEESTEDTMTMEDLELMGKDKCEQTQEGSCKKQGESSESSSNSHSDSDDLSVSSMSSGSSMASSVSSGSSSSLSLLEEDEDKDVAEAERKVDGAETDLLQISSQAKRHDSHSSHSHSHSSQPNDKISKTIRRLEHQIQKAMLISKTIPDAVKKLEDLKVQEEKVTEERARQEATKTLDEHRKLMAEMTEHITKLRTKLNELVAKRAQLAASDSRLRRELGQFSASSSGSSSSSHSSTH